MYKHIGITFLLCLVPLAWGMENLDAEVQDSMRSALSRGLDRFGGAGVIRKFGRRQAKPVEGEEIVSKPVKGEEIVSKPVSVEETILKPMHVEETASKSVNVEENVPKVVNEKTDDVISIPSVFPVKSVEVTEVPTEVPTLLERSDVDMVPHTLETDSTHEKDYLPKISEPVDNDLENHIQNVVMKKDDVKVETPTNVEIKKPDDTESDHQIPKSSNDDEFLVGNLFDDDQRW